MLDPAAGYRAPGRPIWAPHHHQTPADGYGVYSLFPEPGYAVPRQSSPYHALLSPHKAESIGFNHNTVHSSHTAGVSSVISGGHIPPHPATLHIPAAAIPVTQHKSRSAKNASSNNNNNNSNKRSWEDIQIKQENGSSRNSCACSSVPSKKLNTTGASSASNESGCSRTTPVSLSVVKKEPSSTPCQVAEVTTSVRVKQELPDPVAAVQTNNVPANLSTGPNSNIPVGIAVARQRSSQDHHGHHSHHGNRLRDDPPIPPPAVPHPPPPLLVGCDERSMWPAATATATQSNLQHWQYSIGDPQPHSIPVGFQLARDPVSGHFLLIPATNVGVMLPCELGSAAKSSPVNPSQPMLAPTAAASNSGLTLIQQLSALSNTPQFSAGSVFIQHISNTNTVPQPLIPQQSAGSVLISTQQLSGTETATAPLHSTGSVMISNHLPSLSPQLLGQLTTTGDANTALITTPSLVINQSSTSSTTSVTATVQQSAEVCQPAQIIPKTDKIESSAVSATDLSCHSNISHNSSTINGTSSPVTNDTVPANNSLQSSSEVAVITPPTGRRSQATSPVSCLNDGTSNNGDILVESEDDQQVIQASSTTVQDASNQTDTPPLSDDEGGIQQSHSPPTISSAPLQSSITQLSSPTKESQIVDDVSTLNGLELLSYSIERYVSNADALPVSNNTTGSDAIKSPKRIKLEAEVDDNIHSDNSVAFAAHEIKPVVQTDLIVKNIKIEKQDLEESNKIPEQSFTFTQEKESSLGIKSSPVDTKPPVPQITSESVEKSVLPTKTLSNEVDLDSGLSNDSSNNLCGLNLLLCALAHQQQLDPPDVKNDNNSKSNDDKLKENITDKNDSKDHPKESPKDASYSTPTVQESPFQVKNEESVTAQSTAENIIASIVPHNYRSRESEQEVRRILASKQTYEMYRPLSPCDPNEQSMRSLLADLQKQYKAKQRELSRLSQPLRKLSTSGSGGHHANSDNATTNTGANHTISGKRGPGRPRKNTDDSCQSSSSGSGNKHKKHSSTERHLSPEAKEETSKRYSSLSPKRQSLSDGDLSPPVLEPSWSALPQCNDSRVPPILTPNDDNLLLNCDDPLSSFKLSSHNNHYNSSNNNIINNNSNNINSVDKKKVHNKVGCDTDNIPPDIVDKLYDRNHSTNSVDDEIDDDDDDDDDDDIMLDKVKRADCASGNIDSNTAVAPDFFSNTASASTVSTNQEWLDLDSPTKSPPPLSPAASLPSDSNNLSSSSSSHSSSKKRKVGRPKKRDEMREVSTEMIVAKKPRCSKSSIVNYLLNNNNNSPSSNNTSPIHKIRPKLKAEAKVKLWCEDDDMDWTNTNSNSSSSNSVIYENNNNCKKLEPLKQIHRRTSLPESKDWSPVVPPPTKGSSVDGLRRPMKSKSLPGSGNSQSNEKVKQHRNSNSMSLNKKIKFKSHHSSSSPTRVSATAPSGAQGILSNNGVAVGNSNCRFTVEQLAIDKFPLRVLVAKGGLFYAGELSAVRAPDLYGVTLDGERAHRPHIHTQEEVLQDIIREVKPDVIPSPGKRVCAFWSQQYRCLYPGSVAPYIDSVTSPRPHNSSERFVCVDFDDGDNGRIAVDDIRLLPDDYPIVEYDPNPLLTLGKRKRRNSAASSESNNKPATLVDLRERKRLKKKKKEKYRLECEQRGESGIIESTKKHKHKHHDCLKPHKHHKHKHRHRKHKHKYTISSMTVGDDTTGNEANKIDEDEADADGDNEEAGDENLTPLALSPFEQSPPLLPIDKPQASATLSAPAPILPMEQVEESEEPDRNQTKKDSAGTDLKSNPTSKAKKGRDRQGSVEGKSKMAAFLPARQLWKWSGRGYRRPGTKGRGRKEFFKAIHRENETISVGDCAVFLSTGRPDRPYIGRIESMWSSWTHSMVVKVKWFYHPEETVGCPEKLPYPGALFESSHNDENDVQTISHKCEVVSLEEYKKWLDMDPQRLETVYDYNDVYYLAGHYDPTAVSLTFEPGII